MKRVWDWLKRKLFVSGPVQVGERFHVGLGSFVSSSRMLVLGSDVYVGKCAHCHGDSGKGDGRDANRYDPAPTDFTDSKQMSGVTDGELFYKISEGKKPMPMFKNKLTEDQRWELVLLIRSFAKPATPAANSTAK